MARKINLWLQEEETLEHNQRTIATISLIAKLERA